MWCLCRFEKASGFWLIGCLSHSASFQAGFSVHSLCLLVVESIYFSIRFYCFSIDSINHSFIDRKSQCSPLLPKEKNSVHISAYNMSPTLFSGIKTTTKPFLGEEGLLGFYVLSHGLLKKLRVRTRRQRLKQRPWRNAVCGLALHGLLNLNPHTTQDHLSQSGAAWWSGPSHNNHQSRKLPLVGWSLP